MAKTKYKFDPESLEFKEIQLGFKERIAHIIIKYFSPSLFLAFFFAYLFSYFFDTPEERNLKRQLEQYEAVKERLNQAEKVLAELQDRDDNIYRAIFGMRPVPSNIRQAGIGGAIKYTKLEQLGSSKQILETSKRVDKLAKQIVVQSRSFDDVAELVKSKREMIASIPAIQPVSNKDLRRRPYGYGPRIDPIYKKPAFHHGMDFSAPTGTKIYATGNGVITRADARSRGYGKHVRIKHGYGYATLYAHMSKILVKPGQKVKRGDLIGLVGNTGKSVGSHLHYEVRLNGKSVNPIYYYYEDLSATDYAEMTKQANSVGQSLD